MRDCADVVLCSLRQQAAAAVVQQVSSPAVQQVPSAVTRRFGLSDEKATAALGQSASRAMVVLPRPFDTFVNATPGPYVPGGRLEALAFTVSVIVTPLVSVEPKVELAVSQDGVLIE